MKDARTRLQKLYFPGHITHRFSMIYTGFDENPLTWQFEKENKTTQMFKLSQLYWSFSSDIMVSKGLISKQKELSRVRNTSHQHSVQQRLERLW